VIGKLAIGFAVLTMLRGVAQAEEITLACSLVKTNEPGKFFIQADQFVINFEENSADLRIAKTMATSQPVNWFFITRKDSLSDDVFKVVSVGGTISGGGLYGDAPHGFVLKSDGTLDWTFISPSYSGPVAIRWHCER
jgi:hypothetical protein